MPIDPVTGLFSRIWKFVDQFALGDEITRTDLDVAMDDIVDYKRLPGLDGLPVVETMSGFLADTDLTYTAGRPTTIAPGQSFVVKRDDLPMLIAPSNASDHQVITAGSVKAYAVARQGVMRAEQFGFLPGQSPAANSAAWLKALAWIQAEQHRCIQFGAYTYDVQDDLGILSKSRSSLLGVHGSTILRKAASSASAKMLQLGTGVDPNETDIKVKGIGFQLLNKTTATGYMLDLDGCSDSEIIDVDCIDAVGFFRFGQTSKVSRAKIRGIGGTFINKDSHPVILGKRFGGLDISDVKAFGQSEGATVFRNSPIMSFLPIGSCDTLNMDDVQLWSKDGSKYGIFIKADDGTANNWKFSNGVIDKTGLDGAAIWIEQTAACTATDVLAPDGSNQKWRVQNVKFENYRCDTGGDASGGRAFYLRQNAATIHARIRSVHLVNCNFTARDRSAVKTDTTWAGGLCSDVGLIGGVIREADSTALESLVEIGTNGFFMHKTNAAFAELNETANVQHFVKVVDPLVTDYKLDFGNTLPISGELILHPAYAAQSSARGAQALRPQAPVLDTRANFVLKKDGLNHLTDGTVVWAGGLGYLRQAGATGIADLPGWVPNGDVLPDHFPGATYALQLAAALTYQSSKSVLITNAGDTTATPSTYSGSMIEYTGERIGKWTHSATTFGPAKRTIKAQHPAHAATAEATVHIETQAIGSGVNGPSTADYGLSVALHKQNYAVGTSLAGEMDAITVFVRQDGPKGLASGAAGSSDATGMLLNVQNVGDCGYIALIEGTSTNIDPGTFAITRSIQAQMAPQISNASGAPVSYGSVVVSKTGANDHAFHAAEAGGTWDTILNAPTKMRIDGSGNYYQYTSGYPSGAWSMVRAAGDNGAMTLTQHGTGALVLLAQDSTAIQFFTANTMRAEVTAAGDLRADNLVPKKIAYRTGQGAGGTVTQATSKATAVTLNTRTGQITLNNSALGAGAQTEFTLNNSTIGANSMLRINAQTTSTDYRVGIVSVSNGRATIEITNKSAGSLSQAFVIAFEVIDIAST